MAHPRLVSEVARRPDRQIRPPMIFLLSRVRVNGESYIGVAQPFSPSAAPSSLRHSPSSNNAA
jgi:hypothetical protein